jgi:pimeloyl-ACP methyl ester carboxylesterase
VHLRFGLDMETATPEGAVAATSVPVFLIHGLNDRNIPPCQSEDMETQNPSKVILWRVAGAAHCGAHGVSPQEFERLVLAWFSSHSS